MHKIFLYVSIPRNNFSGHYLEYIFRLRSNLKSKELAKPVIECLKNLSGVFFRLKLTARWSGGPVSQVCYIKEKSGIPAWFQTSSSDLQLEHGVL